MIKEKQCPVCGTKDDTEDGIIYTYFVPSGKYSISCENCGCSTRHCDTEDDAEAAWDKMCEMKKENKEVPLGYIDIKVLLPLLKKGWVAMDEDRHSHWYSKKPTQALDEWIGTGHGLSAFNIKPVEDWKNSLMECGL